MSRPASATVDARWAAELGVIIGTDTHVGGHQKLPSDGHESARWRSWNLPGGGHGICPEVTLLSRRVVRGVGPFLGCDWRC